MHRNQVFRTHDTEAVGVLLSQSCSKPRSRQSLADLLRAQRVDRAVHEVDGKLGMTEMKPIAMESRKGKGQHGLISALGSLQRALNVVQDEQVSWPLMDGNAGTNSGNPWQNTVALVGTNPGPSLAEELHGRNTKIAADF